MTFLFFSLQSSFFFFSVKSAFSFSVYNLHFSFSIYNLHFFLGLQHTFFSVNNPHFSFRSTIYIFLFWNTIYNFLFPSTIYIFLFLSTFFFSVNNPRIKNIANGKFPWERFLAPPPPINFAHNQFFFFQQISIHTHVAAALGPLACPSARPGNHGQPEYIWISEPGQSFVLYRLDIHRVNKADTQHWVKHIGNTGLSFVT